MGIENILKNHDKEMKEIKDKASETIEEIMEDVKPKISDFIKEVINNE